MAATRSSSGNRRTAAKPKRATASRARSRATSTTKTTASRNGSGEGVKETLNGAVGDVGGAVKSVAAPVATAVVGAAAGVLGGVVLGRTKLHRPRKVLGIKLPAKRDGMESLAKNVGEAGKQFGKLAGEVRAARQKAESVGKALG